MSCGSRDVKIWLVKNWTIVTFQAVLRSSYIDLPALDWAESKMD